MHRFISNVRIIHLLLSHRGKDESRSLSSADNKVAKAIICISFGFVVIYLMALAILFSSIVNEDHSMTASEFLCMSTPFVFVVDNVLHFSMQQSPVHVVKPYILLPLPRYICIDTLIASSMAKWTNFIWLSFALPFALMSILFSYGILTTLYDILYFQLFIFISGQLYAVTRALVNRTYVGWLLPVLTIAALGTPLYVGSEAGISQFAYIYSIPGSLIDSHNPLPIVLAICVLATILIINRHLQYVGIEKELCRSMREKRQGNIFHFSFLERYGEIGQFIQLEIKLLSRNKNPRDAFIGSLFVMVLVCTLIVISDVYDSLIMTNFWALYGFVLFGSVVLLRLMGYEGNYIDSLLTKRENILNMLKAKYVFYSTILIVPFVMMLPPVVTGKWSLYMLISYAIFTMGFQYFIVFHIAIYSKIALPLNKKMISRGGLNANYVNMLIFGIVFFVPNIIVDILQMIFSENIAYSIMLTIGVAFVSTHKMWLRYIYDRMMKRKYVNLEGFISTRE